MTKKKNPMARFGKTNGRWRGGISKEYYRRIMGCKPNDGKVVHHETGKYKNPKKSDLEVISSRGRISALGMHNKEHPEKGGNHVAHRLSSYEKQLNYMLSQDKEPKSAEPEEKSPKPKKEEKEIYIPTESEIEEAKSRVKPGKPPKQQNKPWYMDRRRRYPPNSQYRGKGNVYGGRTELGNREHKGMKFEPVAARPTKRQLYKILRKGAAYSNYYRIYTIRHPLGKGPKRENRLYVLYIGPPKPSHGRIVTKPSRRELYEKQKRRYQKSLTGQTRRRWR